MASVPDFNDPSYGWNAPDGLAAIYGQPVGALAGQPAAALGGPLRGGDWRANLQQFLDPQVALPIAAQLLGGQTARQSLAGAFQSAGEAIPGMRQRAAANAWLKSQSGLNLTPEEQQILQANPELVQNIAAARFAPRPLVAVAPGSRLANPLTGQFVDGGAASGRGDGSAYDLEQAAKAYKAQYGEGANLAIDAPDFQAWYRSAWPQFGQGQAAAGGQSGGAAAGGQPLPKRPLSDTDIARYNRASNAATKNWIELPGYKLVAQGAPYLSRIEAAAQHPGSVSDQELLDSVTKLNNAGGQVTEAQVAIVLKGASLSDKAEVWKNQIAGRGGVLSPDQRKQLIDVAHAVYAGYQKMYQPVYDDAVKKLKAQGIPEQYWNIPDLNALSRAAGVAGGSGNAPAVGAVEDGYRFKGGNPADPNSWEPEQ